MKLNLKKLIYNNKFKTSQSKHKLSFLSIEKRSKKGVLLDEGIETF